MKWIVTGTWSGYRTEQIQVCHRTVVVTPKRAEALAAISAIVFSDGTSMWLDVRPAKPRERVQEHHGYDALLNRAIARGLTGRIHVDLLDDAEVTS